MNEINANYGIIDFLPPHIYSQEESVELANLLRAGDFTVFETHLKSLVHFYNQAAGGNCEPSLMYKALSAIEAVLITINQNW